MICVHVHSLLFVILIILLLKMHKTTSLYIKDVFCTFFSIKLTDIYNQTQHKVNIFITHGEAASSHCFFHEHCLVIYEFLKKIYY